jgi:primosomal protein N' (replication factor Y)
MIPFFKWTSDYYMHPIGDVIKCALPGGLNLYDFVTIAITEKGEETLFKNSVTPLEGEILNRLETESCRLKDLCKNLNKHIPNALIHDMERRGLIVHKRKLKGGTTRQKTVRHVSFVGSDTF